MQYSSFLHLTGGSGQEIKTTEMGRLAGRRKITALAIGANNANPQGCKAKALWLEGSIMARVNGEGRKDALQMSTDKLSFPVKCRTSVASLFGSFPSRKVGR